MWAPQFMYDRLGGGPDCPFSRLSRGTAAPKPEGPDRMCDRGNVTCLPLASLGSGNRASQAGTEKQTTMGFADSEVLRDHETEIFSPDP